MARTIARPITAGTDRCTAVRSAAWAVAVLLGACGADDAQRLPSASTDASVVDAAGLDGGPDGGARDGGARDAGTLDVGPRDGGAPESLIDRLRAITGADVVDHTVRGGPPTFALTFDVPVDHDAPDGPTLPLRAVLVHRDPRAPVVMHMSGYALFGPPEELAAARIELSSLLDANDLILEHRFFGASVPTPAPPAAWRQLTIAQSARDTHAVRERLRALYEGPWVATGYSKGGMTALFHATAFPGDFAAVVPYVAPLSLSVGDPRYVTFVAQIGPSDGACRAAVLAVAHAAVARRAELGNDHARIDPAAARLGVLEREALVAWSTLDWHWGFWQYQPVDACAGLPSPDAPISLLAGWFPSAAATFETVGMFDPTLSPYTYQLEAELGGPATSNDHLQPELDAVDFGNLPEILVEPPPWGEPPSFDGRAVQATLAHLSTRAERVLAVYGEYDPWTAGRIPLREPVGGRVLTAPRANHGASIADLTEPDRMVAVELLEQWVGRARLVRRTTLDGETLGRLERAAPAHRTWARAAGERDRAVRLRRWAMRVR
jgi:hypothetical protein